MTGEGAYSLSVLVVAAPTCHVTSDSLYKAFVSLTDVIPELKRQELFASQYWFHSYIKIKNYVILFRS